MVTLEKMKPTEKTPPIPTEVSSGSDDDSSECENFNVHDYDDEHNEVEKEVENEAYDEVENETGKEPVNEHMSEAVKGKGKLVVSDDEVDCDELNSGSESDEECERNKTFPIFNVALKEKNLTFKLGMIFSDHKVLKDAIKSYQIKNGRDIIIVRSEALRVKAVCTSNDECLWSLCTSKM